MTTQMQKAKRFRKLHVPGEPLVLFNTWDPGSAKAVTETGALAIATSSWAVSEASGYSDGEHTPLTFAMDNLRRITEATELPVTVDLESGYGDTPRKDSSLIAKALERAEAYAGAGADGLFVPGLSDLALITELTKASPLPVNIMVSQNANISALAKRGVARISFGADPYVVTISALQEAARKAVTKSTNRVLDPVRGQQSNYRVRDGEN